jgi:hypothetical protein
MSVVQIEIPEAVMEQARRLAARTRQSVEQVISDAVTAHAAREEQLAGFYARAERGKRITRERFVEILQKADNAKPDTTDRID